MILLPHTPLKEAAADHVVSGLNQWTSSPSWQHHCTDAAGICARALCMQATHVHAVCTAGAQPRGRPPFMEGAARASRHGIRFCLHQEAHQHRCACSSV